MKTKPPRLDEQMMWRFQEVLSAHKDVAMTVRQKCAELNQEAMRMVLAGELVHILYRKGSVLICTWVPKGWVRECAWLFDAYST